MRFRYGLIGLALIIVGLSSLAAEETVAVDRSDITHIQGISYYYGFVVIERDLIGSDRRVDRLEIRAWDDDLGYSVPVVLVLDEDGDGVWDVAYCLDSPLVRDEYLWADDPVALIRRESKIVGLTVKDTSWDRLLSLVLAGETVRVPAVAADELM